MNTIIEKIRAEALRLIRESDGPGSQYGFGKMSACNRILNFLDTIQEQPIADGLEEETEKFIEEKAKAYDEALEDMRVIYPNLKGEVKLAVEHAFPQLCESEDERIRKGLIHHLKELRGWKVGTMSPIKAKEHYDVWIANLEKQEQKPAWSEEDEKLIRLIISILEDKHPNVFWRSNEMKSGVYTEELVDFLKRLRPSWKPSRAQMSMLLAVLNEPNNASSESCHLALAELYEELKKL